MDTQVASPMGYGKRMDKGRRHAAGRLAGVDEKFQGLLKVTAWEKLVEQKTAIVYLMLRRKKRKC
jgi:hypothetical protein